MHFFFDKQKTSSNKYMLDQVSVSPAVAYGLRKLRNPYTGNAIRVRRSSDNAEQDIGFTSKGDLDTSALTAFVGASDGFVTTWYDQSANGNNAVQSTAGNQPYIVVSGTVHTQNSKPSVKFGSGHYLNMINSIAATDFSVYFVTNPAEDSIDKIGPITVGGDALNVQFRIGIGGYAIFSFYDSFTFISSSIPIDLANLSQSAFVRNGNTVNFYQNGTAVGVDTAGASIDIRSINTYSSNVAGGAKNSTSEILIFTSAHSLATRRHVEYNQGKYYNIAV